MTPLLDVLDAAQRALPGVNAGSLVAALGGRGEGGGADGTPGVVAVVDGTRATLVLACLVVGFVLLAAVLHARRDVP